MSSAEDSAAPAANGGPHPAPAGADAASPPAKPLNDLFSHLPTTIFEVMSKLAVEHNSVNLGQGFPGK